MISRRQFTILPLAGTVLGAHADTYPSRPIRVVVPLSPATGTDAMARFVANAMAKRLNVNMIVENKPGASMTMGAESVARSAPDGYTVLFTSGGHLSIPSVYGDKLTFDARNDLTGVAQVAASALIVGVSAEAPWKTLGELLADAKARPDKITFSSSGVGSAGHLTAALLWSQAGVQLRHVPYKVASQAVMDAVIREVDVSVSGMSGMSPLVKAGKLRALGVTSAKRSELMPDVPTVAEAGLRDYEVISPIFAMVRTGTPAAIVQTLSSAMMAVAATPEFKEQCKTHGLDVAPRNAAELQAALPKEYDRWRQMAQLTGTKTN
ncbi:Bug family tripartite tricarboxylate transporter substrate binding protein [Ramlibacter sp.]|uniref:Bug family tripartite tricarboxylate transporter substrate binding protein n=1 Tax=Ramlibacter sp. TaxID=1917967 RepID=UPI003D0A8B78